MQADLSTSRRSLLQGALQGRQLRAQTPAGQVRKGHRVANGALLVICGALPLVIQTKANGGVLMVLAGLFAFFAKPKAAVA